MSYQTYFFVFPDQATALNALAAANLARLDEANNVYYDHGVDIVGLNPRELDKAAGCYDSEGNPIWKEHEGYHVNLLSDKPLHDALAEYRVSPNSPFRVFAGV